MKNSARHRHSLIKKLLKTIHKEMDSEQDEVDSRKFKLLELGGKLLLIALSRYSKHLPKELKHEIVFCVLPNLEVASSGNASFKKINTTFYSVKTSIKELSEILDKLNFKQL